MNKYLAFDVGGTTIKAALIDESQGITYVGKYSTNRNQNDCILKIIDQVSRKVCACEHCSGVGISTAGIVDEKNGRIMYAGPTIPGYMGTELGSTLSASVHLPIRVVNDVDAALLGELLCGCAQSYTDVYCVALGTGIGGAHYVDGKLINGAHWRANSVGYMDAGLDNYLTWEQRSSTIALEKRLSGLGLTPIDAFAQMDRDPNVGHIMMKWFDEIGRGLANIILIIDPELLLIGGAVSLQEECLIKPLKTAVRRHLPKGFLDTEIKAAQLHNDAALYGAVAPFIME
ncbi:MULTISPECIES: ROK family protein [unclassified Ligilactobacillus]|uniref:ROK family protein n=1 Tax=unclassified Ligilactobacillus TaxID=2767920 RepID=UPI003852991E